MHMERTNLRFVMRKTWVQRRPQEPVNPVIEAEPHTLTYLIYYAGLRLAESEMQWFGARPSVCLSVPPAYSP